MKRREFIANCAAALVGATGSHAQTGMVPLIGFLRTTSRDASTHLVDAFQRGLGDAGLTEGRTHRIAYRFADGKPDRLPDLTRELIALRPALLFGNGIAAREAKAQTTDVPIVFVAGSDPVLFGLVQSLNRPGGNVTGISIDPATSSLEPKRLELLSEIVAAGGKLAFLSDPRNPTLEHRLNEIRKAAVVLRREVVISLAGSGSEIAAAFAAFAKQGASGVLIGGGPHFIGNRHELVRQARSSGLPAIYVLREFAVAGGLLSYGASQPAAYRQAGQYAGRILKGERAGDLPVAQATRFELVLNLKTARAMGIAMPAKLLAIADEVIE